MITREVEDIVCCNDCLGACQLGRCLCAKAAFAAGRLGRSCRCGDIAAHKAALKLTSEQEKNWPAYEAALRKLAKLRVERYQEQKPADPVELLRQRAEDLSGASAALKQLADAEEPLLNSLDDAQKRRFSTYGGNGPLIDV